MSWREFHRTMGFEMISRRGFGSLCFGLCTVAYVSRAMARNSRSIDMVTIEHGWAQFGIDGPGTSVVYLTIRNESQDDDYLLAVDSDSATATMIHDAKKQPMPFGLLVPGYNRVVMEPQGSHVLLSGILKSVATAQFLPVRVVLRDAGSLDFSVPLVS
ncbi:MAG: copper chaperone PCu(A)C [Pseudomonadota bacterium]